MARIKVFLLNYHFITSHMEVLLINLSNSPPTVYRLNRWASEHQDEFLPPIEENLVNNLDRNAFFGPGSIFSFFIEADPDHIIQEWKKYLSELLFCLTFYNNCADATQWFLKTFAGIPDPKRLAAPFTFNHAFLGIPVPSVLPIGINLPGRVMDNAKFHIRARANKTKHAAAAPSVALNISITAFSIATAGSAIGIIATALFLSGMIATLTIAAFGVAGLMSTSGLFKMLNIHAASDCFNETNSSSPKEIAPATK